MFVIFTQIGNENLLKPRFERGLPAGGVGGGGMGGGGVGGGGWEDGEIGCRVGGWFGSVRFGSIVQHIV